MHVLRAFSEDIAELSSYKYIAAPIIAIPPTEVTMRRALCILLVLLSAAVVVLFSQRTELGGTCQPAGKSKLNCNALM